jgi:hypothetical protein
MPTDARPDPEKIIAEVLEWSETVIERPHPVFGDLPICPFARAARLRRTVQFRVMPFDVDDPLAADGTLIRLVTDFAREQHWETLFVIHPDRGAVGARALEQFVAALGRRLRVIPSLSELRVFEAHPESEFSVGGVFTRRSPYPSFQVLSHARLKTASDSLLGSQYYGRFTPAMLRAVGMPRS